MNFLTFDDGFTCEVKSDEYTWENHYSKAIEIRSGMTDLATCRTEIEKIFKILDLDGNGIIEKCEDATFQHAAGSPLDYSLKFSGRFDMAALKIICNEYFTE